MAPASTSQIATATGSTSFRLGVLARVQQLVTEARLDTIPEVCEIILSVMDTIHHYTEEGVRLFPELLLTTSLDPLVESIAQAQFVEIGQVDDINAGIATAVKRCAPLAIGGWVIAIEFRDASLRYGVITVETSELSPSVYRHVVGDLSLPEMSDNVVYIRGLGVQRVEIRTRNSAEIVSMSLRENESDGQEVGLLADAITRTVAEDWKSAVRFFFAKTLGEALRHSHGCIIAAIEDTPDAIEQLKQRYHDGAYLDVVPVDFAEAIKQSQEIADRRAWMAVRNYSLLMKGMISSDGITIFSTGGRLIAYNVFVPRGEQEVSVRGGARSRAFHAVSASGLVACCFALSQDGGMKFWRKPDEN